MTQTAVYGRETISKSFSAAGGKLTELKSDWKNQELVDPLERETY